MSIHVVVASRRGRAVGLSLAEVVVRGRTPRARAPKVRPAAAPPPAEPAVSPETVPGAVVSATVVGSSVVRALVVAVVIVGVVPSRTCLDTVLILFNDKCATSTNVFFLSGIFLYDFKRIMTFKMV